MNLADASEMSTLELLLWTQIEQARLPLPLREAEIVPGKRAFDFAYPSLMIAIEVDGGTWLTTGRGRSAGHAHPARIAKDNEKRNLARLAGWRVFQFTTEAVNDGSALEIVRELVGEI